MEDNRLNKFDEYKALEEIRDGKLLCDFHIEDYDWDEGKEPVMWPTRLMVLATLTYHGKDAYMEIPEHCWTARAAKMAMQEDYHAIEYIPPLYKSYCAKQFTDYYLKNTRKELVEYLDVLRKQPEEFQLACARINPGLSTGKIPILLKNRSKNIARSMPLPPKAPEEFTVDLSEDEEYATEDELTPEAFLLLPVEKQTKERLYLTLDQDLDFPEDFIKRLSIPNRNAVYYSKQGKSDNVAFWKEKIIPYLNKEVCLDIAKKHPEASIKTPVYLDKESVLQFWNRKKTQCSSREMTAWFLKFPPELLDESMRPDLYVNWQVLKYAPDIFLGSEEARHYLLRSPNDVLKLPEYQSAGILLLDGVRLNNESLNLIANEKFREKVRLALNIQ